jgi:TM2 domain-containing membrane protein YozV
MPYTIAHCLPELDQAERSFIEHLTVGMSEADVQQFASAYRHGRMDPQTVLLMAVIGIVAVPGLHRFALRQVGMGFLYLLTYGLLLFGTITDIIKHKELAFTYNRQLAKRIASNLFQPGNSLSMNGAFALNADSAALAQRHHPV